jgi:hypothetical protein
MNAHLGNKFIDLDRRFREFNSKDNDEFDEYQLELSTWRDKTTFQDILLNDCSVILASAGSGKTWELQNQADLLVKKGETAFFCDLSILAKLDFLSCITRQKEFQEWLESDAIGYFFLDSVDESRLTANKEFMLAVLKFANSINSHIGRARIIISSRPSSWHATEDKQFIETMLNKFQVSHSSLSTSLESENNSGLNITKHALSNKIVKVYRLAPLNRIQIEKFAKAREITDLQKFINAIVRAGCASFLARPLDLEEMITFWKANKSIRSYSETIENNIQSKLTETNPSYIPHTSSVDTLQYGAECLAAALTFEKKKIIWKPDSHGNHELKSIAIDPAYVLPDWDRQQIDKLLRLPLFDEALYGTIGFDHRITREFLTAKFLLRLIMDGKSRSQIEDIFFVKEFNKTRIPPSLKPIVAWLSAWDHEILQKVLELDFQILLEYGDPSLLPINTKKLLLEKFVKLNIDRIRVGLSLNLQEVTRFASQDLKETVQSILLKFKKHAAITQLMLRLIWLGPIEECGKAVRNLATDEKLDSYTRICALRAIGTAGSFEDKNFLVNNILKKKYSNGEFIATFVEYFFPEHIDVNIILKLIKATSSPKESSIDYLSRQIKLKIYKLSYDAKVFLFQHIKALLERKPYKNNLPFNLSLRYHWLLGLAFSLAVSLLEQTRINIKQDILDILLLIHDIISYDPFEFDDKQSFNDLINENRVLSRSLFWYGIEQLRKAEMKTLIHVPYGLRSFISLLDLEYLLEYLNSSNSIDNKFIALHILLCLYAQNSNKPDILKQIKQSSKRNPVLTEHFKKLFLDYKTQIKENNKPISIIVKRKERKDQRKKFIDDIKFNIDQIKDAVIHAQPSNYVIALYNETINLDIGRSYLAIDRWDGLANEFGYDVATAYRDYCINFWSRYNPELNPQNSNKNSIPWAVSIGLSGLAMLNNSSPTWINEISSKDAVTALKYALLELNGFPSWFPELFLRHSDILKSELMSAIEYEMNNAEDDKSSNSLLTKLRAFNDTALSILYSDFLNLLKSNDQSVDFLFEMLSLLMRNKEILPDSFAVIAEDRFNHTKIIKVQALWLACLFCIQPETAWVLLINWSDNSPTSISKKKIIEFFNYLLNSQLHFFSNNKNLTVSILDKLIRIAFKYLPPSEDAPFKSGFTNNFQQTRVRDHLINILKDIPGNETSISLMKLSFHFHSLGLTIYRDTLFIFAEERANQDIEFIAWRNGELKKFIDDSEKEPKTENDLFVIAKNRINYLKSDIEAGDHSEAILFQRFEKETELRNAFVNHLTKVSKDKYTISSEDELADGSQTDIKFHAANHKINPVPSELKIYEKWKPDKLIESLKDQLVGKYMKISKCGIFLLVRRGNSNDSDHCFLGKSRKKLFFPDVVKLLQDEANKLLLTDPTIRNLEVIGIDLSMRFKTLKKGKPEN